MRRLLSLSLLLAALTMSAVVKPGVEVLRDGGFKELQGKRVGLVTNPSGIDNSLKSTVDILNEAPGVKLVALFGPEHGVRGNAHAGDAVGDAVDPKTGIKMYSLFGKTHKPTAEMLKGIDVLVYDIQDVGCRSYTFYATMGVCMEACAENGVEFMVLDRPNPLGGNKVEGPLVRDGFYSFVSQYRIPFVYGLTVGELAMLINEEGLNCGQTGDQLPLRCSLTVVPMEGWERSMTYEQTGLPWVMPSPNIPYPRSAVCYPCAGLVGEFNNYLNIGIGYTIPFDAFAAEWIDADALKARLDSYNVPGVAWRAVHYTPFYGSSARKLIHGVQYYFTDYQAAPLTLVQFYVIQAVWELYKKNPFELSAGRLGMFNKVCGTDFVSKEFSKRFKVSDIAPYWTADVEDFKTLSKKYYLY